MAAIFFLGFNVWMIQIVNIRVADGQVPSWQQASHRGWTLLYCMYDPMCSTTFPWCTINAPAAFAWYTMNVPGAFAWFTTQFVHKVRFSYIGWDKVHTLVICSDRIDQSANSSFQRELQYHAGVAFSIIFRFQVSYAMESQITLYNDLIMHYNFLHMRSPLIRWIATKSNMSI